MAEVPAPAPLQVSYDAGRDELTIDGIIYSGNLFRDGLHKLTPTGVALRVLQVHDTYVVCSSIKLCGRCQLEAEGLAHG
jgi:hypothetical protein